MGCFILCTILVFVAVHISQCSARKKFPEHKAKALQKIRSAGAKGDSQTLDGLEGYYGSGFDEADYQSAMKAARHEIARDKATFEGHQNR